MIDSLFQRTQNGVFSIQEERIDRSSGECPTNLPQNRKKIMPGEDYRKKFGLEEALFGLWSFDNVTPLCTLSLRADRQYVQEWNQGSIIQGGFWTISYAGPQAFIVLTLMESFPATDFGIFGWQPALIGSQTVLAVRSLEDRHLNLFGATLTMVTRYTAAPPAPLPSANAPRPASPAPAAGSDKRPAATQWSHAQDDPAKFAAEGALEFNKNWIASQKANMDSLSAAIHAGNVYLTNTVLKAPSSAVIIPPKRR